MATVFPNDSGLQFPQISMKHMDKFVWSVAVPQNNFVRPIFVDLAYIGFNVIANERTSEATHMPI